MRSIHLKKLLESTPQSVKDKVARYGNRVTNGTFTVKIKPLQDGQLPRLAFVTPSTTVGGLVTYKVKSILGATEMWKHEFDHLIETGQYEFQTSRNSLNP